MTTTQLDTEKRELSEKVDVLVSKKKRLYSNMDIESPMSTEEKELNKEIATIYSSINKIVKQKNQILKQKRS